MLFYIFIIIKKIYRKVIGYDLETEIRIRRLRFNGHKVRMDQGRLNKRVFDRIHEYKSVGGYVNQMREKTEKLKITDKNCLDREQYGKKFKEKKVLVENKEKRKILRGRKK